MERLTIEYCGEYVPRELCSIDRLGGADDCDLCCEYCKAAEEGSEDCRGCAINKCFNRLGEYENLQDKLDNQFDGCLDIGTFVDSIIEYDKQLSRDEKLAEAIMITNGNARKYYEWTDLQKQGLLLKLPCAVGDMVYVLWCRTSEKRAIYKAEVREMRLGKYMGRKKMKYLLEPTSERGKIIIFYDDDFGKTVFPTREEAETALKEL